VVVAASVFSGLPYPDIVTSLIKNNGKLIGSPPLGVIIGIYTWQFTGGTAL